MRDKIARLLYNRKRSHTAGYGRVKVTSFLRCKECFQVLLPLRLIVPVLESRSKSFFFFFFRKQTRGIISLFLFYFLVSFLFLALFFRNTRCVKASRVFATWEYKSLHKMRCDFFFFFNRVQVFVKSAT